MVTVAHISDLHFFKVGFSVKNIFSKGLLGLSNGLTTRRRNLNNNMPWTLLQKFAEDMVTHVIISGDLTTISSPEEYNLAKKFIDALVADGLKVLVVPGNHDFYTRYSHATGVFYKYFPSIYDGHYSLEHMNVALAKISDTWSIVLLNTARAMPFISSNGLFSEFMASQLRSLLGSISSNVNILVVNHFPFRQSGPTRRLLIGGSRLGNIMSQYENIKIYCHGHVHRQSVKDFRHMGYPITINSGSLGNGVNCSYVKLNLSCYSIFVTSYVWCGWWKASKMLEYCL